MLVMTKVQEGELAEKLVENALEDCVSAFDGFGRELCRVHAERTTNPARANRVRFQNLGAAHRELQALGFQLAETVERKAWEEAVKLFQKRHLIAHKMGVVDQEYVDRTGDRQAIRGRKIRVSTEEVSQLSDTLRAMAESIATQFENLSGEPNE